MRRINFESDIGKKLAGKYFGYEYEDIPFSTEVPLETITKQTYVENKTINELKKKKIKNKTETHEKNFNNKYEQNNNFLYKIKEAPTLYDLTKWKNFEGIVGEEKSFHKASYITINGSSFIIKGYSGGGKTFLLDKLVKLLKNVCTIQQSSDLAIFYDADNINKSDIVYITEANKTLKNKKSASNEVLKDWGEGKDSVRSMTSKTGDGTIEVKLFKKQFMTTSAIESYYELNVELSRRLMRIYTDSSKEHLENIQKYKAKKRYELKDFDEEHNDLTNKLRNHIHNCMQLKDVKIIDPFSDYMLNILPITQKSIGFIDHYYSLLDGIAKFNYPKRQKVSFNEKNHIFLNLEDHFNIYNIYFDDFLSSLTDMKNENEQIIYSLPRWSDAFYSGLNVLNTKKELEPLRNKFPNLISNWYNSQVNENKIITQDYKTGDQLIITKLGEVAKP